MAPYKESIPPSFPLRGRQRQLPYLRNKNQITVPSHKMKPKKQVRWGGLAERLKVSRRSLSRWKRLPGCPPVPDFKAWQEFIETNALNVSPTKISPGRVLLLEQNLAKRNHLLDLEIAKQERRTIERATVDELLLHIASLQKVVLSQKLEREMPVRCEGKTAAERVLIGRAILDECCGIFSSRAATWREALDDESGNPERV